MSVDQDFANIDPKAASAVPTAAQMAGGIPIQPVRLLQVMSCDDRESFTEEWFTFHKGKGLRAITHAAVKIGLMKFCRERDLPHPGFVVLDSPLLAYWKPEGDDDDLRGTDLKEMFYRYLLGLHKDNQVIIVENQHPPDFVYEEGNVTVFTKNPHQGRYGFFPIS